MKIFAFVFSFSLVLSFVPAHAKTCQRATGDFTWYAFEISLDGPSYVMGNVQIGGNGDGTGLGLDMYLDKRVCSNTFGHDQGAGVLFCRSSASGKHSVAINKIKRKGSAKISHVELCIQAMSGDAHGEIHSHSKGNQKPKGY